MFGGAGVWRLGIGWGGRFVEGAEAEVDESFVWNVGGVEVGGYGLEDLGG